MRLWGNDYTGTEFSGAFGDLGTLVPFLLGYMTVNKLDPLGIFVSLGIFQIFVGLYFRTPISVQPMKAIGGMAISHPGVVSPGMILGSGVFTGVLWLLMGSTNAVTWIQKITAKPVVRGIMVGLGLSFMTEGVRMMATDALPAIAGIFLTLLLFTRKRFPAILALLCLGVMLAFVRDPSLLGDLGRISVGFRWPTFALGRITWHELLAGSVILGLPQAPLTLGNAIIGAAAENNRHFPDKKVTAKALSIDHGIMNLVSFALGGIPLCHGAGGMAGHVRFGARTGGSLVMLGIIMLLAGLFLSESLSLVLQIFPRSVLGVILFFAGLELAMIIKDIRLHAENLFVLLVTAGLAMWNMGVAFLGGLVLYHLLKRGWVNV
jgi:hypothetical protein